MSESIARRLGLRDYQGEFVSRFFSEDAMSVRVLAAPEGSGKSVAASAIVGRAQELDPTFPITNAVRGMLQRNTLGADMLKRLRVYAGAEHGHAAQKPKVITFDSRGDIKIG